MGFWSGVKKVARAALGIAGQAVNIVKEAANRVFGIVDFIGTLVGIAPTKKLRLRVVILRDENTSQIASVDDVQPSIDRARDIFRRQANTRIVAARGGMIKVVDYAAPKAALEPSCGGRAWTEDLGEAGAFYSLHIPTTLIAAPTGYGQPIVAFIVRNVRGKQGCSLGPLTDYVTVDLDGIAVGGGTGGDDVGSPGPRILAHELAHSCGLWHVSDNSNLADANGSGVMLRRWQKAILRNSRHVTYL